MDRDTATPLVFPTSNHASSVEAEHYACCERCQSAAPRLLGATWSAQATSALWYFRCEACGWVWSEAEDGREPAQIN
jgi:hypothetical protein